MKITGVVTYDEINDNWCFKSVDDSTIYTHDVCVAIDEILALESEKSSKDGDKFEIILNKIS